MTTAGNYSTKRRIFITMVIVVALVVGFAVRLIDLQVVRASSLVADSLEKMSGSSPIYAPRGEIVDTNGTVLASSIAKFDIEISPKDVKETKAVVDGTEVVTSVDEWLAKIGKILGVAPESLQSIVDDALAKDAKANYAVFAKGASYDQYQALSKLGLNWLYFAHTYGRVYPNGAVAGNVVGFVGSENTGLAGIELQQDSCLAGSDGRETYQQSKGAVALPGTTQTLTEAKPGGTVKLTIDSDLNFALQQLVGSQVKATGAEYGMATVIEAKTGKILSIAESPSVDPNDVDGTDAQFRGSQAFQSPFEPGSIFKPLTAAMLIDSGSATPNSHVVAEYRYKPKNGASIKDALPHDAMRLTLTGVLQQSSNTGLSILGEKMTAQQRYDYLKKFGIGALTGLDFPGESAGILHPVDEWDNQTFYTTMFGQGVSTTAMQMAHVYQGIANGGVMLPLQLVEGCTYEDGTVTNAPASDKGTRILKEQTAKDTIAMMETVVTDGFLADELTMPGYRVAAKSGTGEQFVDGKLENVFFASMAGMVPADDPQYVILVHLKSPLTSRSSAAAAPVFKEAVAQVIKKYGIQPATTPGPDLKGTY